MGSLCKAIQLLMGFLKAHFLVLHFSYNILMTFLLMLSVILLSMLMILLHYKYYHTSDVWLLNLNSVLADFSDRKTRLVLFNQFNNSGAIDVKMDGSLLDEKSSFKMLGLCNTLPAECSPLNCDLSGLSLELIDTFLLWAHSKFFHISFLSFSSFCNSMSCSGCSAMHGVKLN